LLNPLSKNIPETKLSPSHSKPSAGEEEEEVVGAPPTQWLAEAPPRRSFFTSFFFENFYTKRLIFFSYVQIYTQKCEKLTQTS